MYIYIFKINLLTFKIIYFFFCEALNRRHHKKSVMFHTLSFIFVSLKHSTRKKGII